MWFVMVCCVFCFLFVDKFWILLYDRSDPDKETQGWGENDRGVSFTFGADVVAKVCQGNYFSIRIKIYLVFKSTWYGFNLSSSSSK